MRKLPEILTADEINKLLRLFNCRYKTNQRNRAMILLAYKIGLRVSEIVNLKWNDIDKNSGRLHLKQGKGKKDRILYASPSLLNELINQSKRYTDNQMTGNIFLNHNNKPVQTQYLRNMIKRKALKSGINKNIHFHTFRHTFATEILKETGNIITVKECLGHSDIKTTAIYLHMCNEDIKRALMNR
jgi:site-specific recombinase XerD